MDSIRRRAGFETFVFVLVVTKGSSCDCLGSAGDVGYVMHGVCYEVVNIGCKA